MPDKPRTCFRKGVERAQAHLLNGDPVEAGSTIDLILKSKVEMNDAQRRYLEKAYEEIEHGSVDKGETMLDLALIC